MRVNTIAPRAEKHKHVPPEPPENRNFGSIDANTSQYMGSKPVQGSGVSNSALQALKSTLETFFERTEAMHDFFLDCC